MDGGFVGGKRQSGDMFNIFNRPSSAQQWAIADIFPQSVQVRAAAPTLDWSK